MRRCLEVLREGRSEGGVKVEVVNLQRFFQLGRGKPKTDQSAQQHVTGDAGAASGSLQVILIS